MNPLRDLICTLPESYKLYFGDGNIEQEMKKNNALILYKQGRISLSKAAELSELDMYSFISECKRNSIPVIEYTEDEINKEIEEILRRSK